MALVKTDYSLVYNDDGSLCTTIREDDVPFEGVKSFAVEEGTENLLQNPRFATGDLTNWSNYTSTQPAEIVDVKIPGVPFLTKAAHLVDNDDTNGAGVVQRINGLSENTVYTFSAWAKCVNSDKATGVYLFIEWYDANDNFLRLDTQELLGETLISAPELRGIWHRTKITSTSPSGASYAKVGLYSTSNNISEVYGTGFQFEQKPFATSFVDGTRQDGRFYIPLEKIPFDVVNDDWIIAYWKKPIATHDNTLTGYNLFSLGRYTSDDSKGYIWWGKASSSNIFRIEAVYNDATTGSADSSTFDPNWYFNNWHFEVLRKADEVIDYFVDGIKQCSLALTTNLQTFVEGLSVGGNFDDPDNNSLIASLAFGYAKNDLGNLVWTDEYIQELYNARKPFKLPANIPVK